MAQITEKLWQLRYGLSYGGQQKRSQTVPFTQMYPKLPILRLARRRIRSQTRNDVPLDQRHGRP